MPAPEPAPIPAPLPKKHPLYGKTIARCVIGARIGRGATSSVYRARYKPLEKDIALKVLGVDKSADEESRARFLEEAKAIAKLDHENIVKVFDVAEDQGHLCILMELVDGDTVQDQIDDGGALPAKRAAKVALDVARALEAAHENDLVHRDIKPANFIVDRKTDTVKVVDFGLAARGATNRVGTPLYMSPEAAQGKQIDDRSDIYALGVSFYQMLTGKHPFTGNSVKEILAAQVNQELVPASKVKPDVGSKYDTVMAKLLVKAKGYRPSATEVVEMLEPLVDEPHREKKQGGGRRGAPVRGGKKSQGPMLMAAAGGVVLVVLLLVFLNQKDEPRTPPVKPPGVGAGSTGGTPAPVVDPAEQAKKAYMDADRWSSENAQDLAGQSKRWAQIEREFSGTEWGRKAADKHGQADVALSKKKADDEQKAKDDRDRKEREEARNRQLEEIPKRIAAWDFEGAATRVNRIGAPEGTPAKEWTRKGTRLEFLAKNFETKLNSALQSSPVSAQKIKATAGPSEQITKVSSSGLVTDAGGKAGSIAWSEVKPDDFFHYVAKKRLSQSRPEDNLFLAILAKELGLEKEAKLFREGVDLTDAGGEVRDRIKEYFVVE
ncbi:MAG: serine/threonine protein kinase [Planctomycetes bacterium]|nr:serine/threonine protein kinase [Planctomycetota bacterium]